MDSTTRILNDFTSWYWWVSIVVVGLAINLLSAYMKAPIDKFMSSASSRRRARRQAEKDEFEAEVARVAANPTLLVLEGQRAAHAEVKKYMQFLLVGLNLVLLYLASGQPEPHSWVNKTLLVLLAVLVPLQLTELLSLIRAESRASDLYHAASERFRDAA